MTKPLVSPTYDEALKVAIVLQAGIMLLLLMLLDGGMLAKVGGAAAGGFWVGAGVVMRRRPWTPSALDLVYLRWGYLAALVVSATCTPFMGVLRGVPLMRVFHG